MADGEIPVLLFKRVTVFKQKVAEVVITKTDQEVNLNVFQCLLSDYALDTKLLQETPNLTLTHIED